MKDINQIVARWYEELKRYVGWSQANADTMSGPTYPTSSLDANTNNKQTHGYSPQHATEYKQQTRNYRKNEI